MQPVAEGGYSWIRPKSWHLCRCHFKVPNSSLSHCLRMLKRLRLTCTGLVINTPALTLTDLLVCRVWRCQTSWRFL